MQVVYERCCGLDVHKKSVVACVLVTPEDGCVQEHVRTFGTMTADLTALSTWLREQQVEHVALESTGHTSSEEGVHIPVTSLTDAGAFERTGGVW